MPSDDAIVLEAPSRSYCLTSLERRLPRVLSIGPEVEHLSQIEVALGQEFRICFGCWPVYQVLSCGPGFCLFDNS